MISCPSLNISVFAVAIAWSARGSMSDDFDNGLEVCHDAIVLMTMLWKRAQLPASALESKYDFENVTLARPTKLRSMISWEVRCSYSNQPRSGIWTPTQEQKPFLQYEEKLARMVHS
jgi:hypothetical protein